MTGSTYGLGWPSLSPVQQTPWGPSQFGSPGIGSYLPFTSSSPVGSPFQHQILQLLQSVPQQLQYLQQLTTLQQQQLQQIQQLLLLVPQQFQQAIQQIAYVVSHQLQQSQQHSTPLQSGIGTSFPSVPFGQQIFPGQPGQVM
jgi:hypothetical protein